MNEQTNGDGAAGEQGATGARDAAGRPSHERPAGVDDATVAAVGKMSEAYEYLIRARGSLYELHQLLGRADLLMGEAAEMLEEAGHTDEAALVDDELVGRNVLDGRWTFQIVEEFDELYFSVATRLEEDVRHRLLGGRRHVFESEMKESRRTKGRQGHTRRPATSVDVAVEVAGDG